jgi:methionine synthase II (cobalamin-independent)
MKNIEKFINLKCKATGIGSIPHTDINSITDYIISKCPDIPYWPQAANINPKEAMLVQYTENLPCLKLNFDNEVVYEKTDRDKNLLKFYEHLTSGDLDYFKLSKVYAGGFYTLLDKLKNSKVDFIKGQVVGPVTLMYSIKGEENKSILFDEVLCDAITRGLAMKGVWQAREIRKLGKQSVIFFDEPAMSGFGSAFMPLGKEQAMTIFDNLVKTVKEHEDAITGIHCCGNSDWGMLLETKIDIINFDSFSFADNFVLYSDTIKKFLKRGGIIAWGAVPTSEFRESTDIKLVSGKLKDAMEKLISRGVDKELLLKRSLFTPACGMGSLGMEIAEKVIDLTNKLALDFTNYS